MPFDFLALLRHNVSFFVDLRHYHEALHKTVYERACVRSLVVQSVVRLGVQVVVVEQPVKFVGSVFRIRHLGVKMAVKVQEVLYEHVVGNHVLVFLARLPRGVFFSV